MTDFLRDPDDGGDFDVDAELAALGMTMEQVDAAIGDLESGLPDELRALWEVPDDLTDRIARKAWRKIQDRQSLTAFGELFGIGWQATRAIIDPVEDADD